MNFKPALFFLGLLWLVFPPGQTCFSDSSRPLGVSPPLHLVHPVSQKGRFENLNRLVGEKDAVLLSDSDGAVIFSKNAGQKRIPASTLKLFSSLFALSSLGLDFRFKTEFFLDDKKNLTIKGYGDPLLISETIAAISKNLKKKLAGFNDLIIDDSWFEKPVHIPGVSDSFEPYDSPNGAFCVNFNTVNFKRDKMGRYVSAEPQTPLLPMALRRVKKFNKDSGRIVFSHKNNENVMYAGRLFHFFLNREGIESSGKIRIRRAEREKSTLVYTHFSEFSLGEIIEKTLRFSNNFMANQLFIAGGAAIFGAPGTLEKGAEAAKKFARDILDIKEIQIVEGSGISRKNRICANTMLKILDFFKPHRNLMRKKGYEYYKTGSLNGIKARAGFFKTDHAGPFSFVVMVNTPGKTTNEIMKELRRIFITHPYMMSQEG